MRCGNCQAVCPVYKEVRREAAVARGKVAIAAALLSGEIEPDDEALRQLDLCLTCTACVDGCPSGVRIDDVILAARAEVVRRRGVSPAVAAVVRRRQAAARAQGGRGRRGRGSRGWPSRAGPEEDLGVPRLPVPRRAAGRSCRRLPDRPLGPADGSAGRAPRARGASSSTPAA